MVELDWCDAELRRTGVLVPSGIYPRLSPDLFALANDGVNSDATLWTRTSEPPAGIDTRPLHELLAPEALTPRWGLPDADTALHACLRATAAG